MAKERIDAIQVLRSLDKEELAKAIVEAKAKSEAANNELRALQSMEKLRAIRAGELKRKSPVRKAKEPIGSPEATPAPQPPPPASPDRPTLKVRIGNWLRENGPGKPHVIALALGVAVQAVIDEVKTDPHSFRRQSIRGEPGWGLA